MQNYVLTQAYVLEMLELLADEGDPARFEELLQRARRDNLAPESATQVERAGELALRVRSFMDNRRQRESDLAALVETARDLSLPRDLDHLLKVVTRQARRLLGLSMSCISLREADGTSAVRSSDGATTDLNVGRGSGQAFGVVGELLKRKAAVWTADHLKDPRLRGGDELDALVRAEGLRAILAVPLWHDESAFGLLFGGDRRVRHFTPDEVSLMVSLAGLAAVAIERVSLLDQAHADVGDLALDRSRSRTELAAIRHMVEVHSSITGRVLDGCDLRALVVAVADALDGTVLLRDPGGRTVARTGEIPDLDPAAVDTAVLDAQARRSPVPQPDGTWIVPVSAAGEDLGALVVRPVLSLTDDDEPLLRLVSQAVAVALLLQRGAVTAEWPVRDELLDDLLSASPPPEHQLLERAGRLGVDLDAPQVLIVARPAGDDLGRAAVWASSYAYRTSGLSMLREGCVVVLVPGTDTSTLARDLSRRLSPLLGHPVSVAAAGPAPGAGAVAGMYQEARRTLEAMTLLHGPGATAAASDLGFLGLLLSDERDVDAFVGRTIGPVLDYDEQHLGELTTTLRMYFDSGGSQRHAADSLHVHPNTVARRLERVTSLLGDWQKPARALEIQLALLLHRTRGALEWRQRQGPARPGSP